MGGSPKSKLRWERERGRGFRKGEGRIIPIRVKGGELSNKGREEERPSSGQKDRGKNPEGGLKIYWDEGGEWGNFRKVEEKYSGSRKGKRKDLRQGGRKRRKGWIKGRYP